MVTILLFFPGGIPFLCLRDPLNLLSLRLYPAPFAQLVRPRQGVYLHQTFFINPGLW